MLRVKVPVVERTVTELSHTDAREQAEVAETTSECSWSLRETSPLVAELRCTERENKEEGVAVEVSHKVMWQQVEA